nr:DNA-directed RNA polymerase [uncultured Anaeromusa sp.]
MDAIAAEISNLRRVHGSLYDTQLELERSYKAEAEETLRESIRQAEAEGQTAQLAVGQRLISYGFNDARTTIDTWYATVSKPKRGVKPSYMSILANIKEVYGDRQEDIVNVITAVSLVGLMNVLKGEHPEANNLAQWIVRELYEEVRLEAFIKTIEDGRTLAGVVSGLSSRSDRSYKIAYAKACMTKQAFVFPEWAKDAKVLLGHLLVELVCSGSGYATVVGVDQATGEKIPSRLEPTDWLLDAWEQNTANLIQYTARFGPTVIPPRPWTNINDGGYYGELQGRHKLIRLKLRFMNTATKEYIERLQQTDLNRVMGVINTIQGTPWRINKRVFETLEYIITECRGERAGVPRMERLPKFPRLENPTEEELKEHKKKAFARYKEDVTRASLALRCTSHLETARRYLDFARIYFPYNMDFRGRVYPISGFSPQSDDVNKGLLEFADAPAFESEEPVKWLMIHGANVAGVDKVSFEDRIKWVQEHEEQILASAEDPIGCRFWETDSFECFQFLAFCFEWQRFVNYKLANGSAVGFVSNLPIAFDGSCSGLQHYSAILRDTVGAKAVNLVPSRKPNDIYREVSDLVNEELEKHAQQGSLDTLAFYDDRPEPVARLGTQTMAQIWLNYGVNRKVTKRSVMTLAYGSRQYGFKEQIIEDTIQPAIDKRKFEGFTTNNRNQLANYLAGLIWKAVQEVVVAAVAGMDFLKSVAKVVSKDGHCVTWVTPMGLPVQQAYTIVQVDQIKLRLGEKIRRWAYVPTATDELDKHAQASGIAPNFIHSMDACHLQMTVEHLKQDYDIQHFALIHDSYGCPAAQAENLFKGVRESFHKMYTEYDVLNEFREQMALLVEDPAELPPLPSKGSFKLSQVLESPYMFA